MTGMPQLKVHVPHVLKPSTELSVVPRAARSATLAFVIHFVISTFRVLLMSFLRRRRSGVFSLKYLKGASRLAGRYAAFLGGLVLLRALARMLLRKGTNWSGNAVEFWAGMCAGQSIHFLPYLTRLDISMYCFVRAVYTMIRLMLYPPAPLLPPSVPAVKTPTSSLPLSLTVPVVMPAVFHVPDPKHLQPVAQPRMPNEEMCTKIAARVARRRVESETASSLPVIESPPVDSVERPLTGQDRSGSVDSLDLRSLSGVEHIQEVSAPPEPEVRPRKKDSFLISAVKSLNRASVESPGIEVEAPEDHGPISPVTWSSPPGSSLAPPHLRHAPSHPIHPPPPRAPLWVVNALNYICPSTVVMGLCACQLFWAMIFGHHTLPPQYLGFLMKFGGTSKEVYLGVAHFCMTQTFTPEIIRHAKRLNLPSPSAWHGRGSDLLIHYLSRGRGPVKAWAKFALWNFIHQCVPLYLPLKIVFVILFSARKALKNPTKAAMDIFISTVRSSLFLALYCANAWIAVCFLLRKGMIRPIALPSAAGISAGLATLIEAPSRRRELAVYCCCQAIPSFFIAFTNYLGVPRPPRIETLAFSVGLGLFMAAARNPWHAGGVDPWVRKGLSYLAGVETKAYPTDSPRQAQRARALMRTVQRSPPAIAVAPPTPTREPNVTRYTTSPIMGVAVVGGDS